jgi:hypothetical protein
MEDNEDGWPATLRRPGAIGKCVRSPADVKRIAELEAALTPFAEFAKAMSQLGGNHPKTGEFYVLRVGGEPVSLTVEDFKAARAALSA